MMGRWLYRLQILVDWLVEWEDTRAWRRATARWPGQQAQQKARTWVQS